MDDRNLHPGHEQTYERYFETPEKYPCMRITKNCNAAGGPKFELCNYINNLCSSIGYSPVNAELSNHLNDDCEQPDEIEEQEGRHFTPNKGQ